LHNKIVDFIKALGENEVPIQLSETSMDNCYDVILENEDYTVGKILELELYERYYDTKDPSQKKLSFCAFKKFHPHYTEGVLRLAFTESVKKEQVRYVMKEVAVAAQEKLKEMYDLF
jgi:DNA-directed RNA polymerase subunit L